MKKIGILLMVLFVLFSPIHTYGDSAAVQEANEIAWDLILLDQDRNLKILEEDILIDFSSYEDVKSNDFTIPARIRVKYKLLNSGDKDETFRLALPYVSSLEDLKPENISIRHRDQEIPFKIHLGQYFYENIYKNHLEGFMDTINYEDYKPKKYDLDKLGLLYKFHIEAEAEENLYMKLKIDNRQDKLLLNGFNGWVIDEGTSYSARIKEKGLLEVFVLDGDIEYELKAYLSTNYARESKDHKLNVKVEQLSLGDYLESSTKNLDQVKTSNYLDQEELLHFYKMELDRRFQEMEEVIFLDDLSLHSYERRYFTLVSQLRFKAGEEKDLVINYTGKGTRDYPEYIDPLYSFDYKFNPREEWSNIKKLNVKIIPSDKTPYLIENNLNLDRLEDGSYEGSFQVQTEEFLKISLYKREKIGRLDKIAKLTKDNLSLVIPLLYLIIFTTPRWIRKKLIEKRDSFYEFDDET